MDVVWVYSSSESTKGQTGSFPVLVGKRAGWPQVASASTPGCHTLLSALRWGSHWPRWSSSSCRSSQRMPGPLGNKSQHAGSRLKELTQGRVHSSAVASGTPLEALLAGQDGSCSANSMPPLVLFPTRRGAQCCQGAPSSSDHTDLVTL